MAYSWGVWHVPILPSSFLCGARRHKLIVGKSQLSLNALMCPVVSLSKTIAVVAAVVAAAVFHNYYGTLSIHTEPLSDSALIVPGMRRLPCGRTTHKLFVSYLQAPGLMLSLSLPPFVTRIADPSREQQLQAPRGPGLNHEARRCEVEVAPVRACCRFARGGEAPQEPRFQYYAFGYSRKVYVNGFCSRVLRVYGALCGALCIGKPTTNSILTGRDPSLYLL